MKRCFLKGSILFGIVLILLHIHTEVLAQRQQQALLNKLGVVDTDAKKVEVLNELAAAATSENNFSEALKYATDALELASETGYEKGEVKACLEITSVYKLRRKFDDALDFAFRAIDRAESLNDATVLYEVYTEVSFVYSDWGVLPKAVEYQQKAYALAKEMNDQSKVGDIAQLLGFTYLKLGNTDKTLKFFEIAKNFYQQQGDDNAYASSLKRISDIYLQRSDFKKALAYNQEILSIKQSAKDSLGASNYLNDIGYIYMRLGEGKQALKYFNEALKLNRMIGRSEDDNAALLINIGVIQQGLGNFDQALANFEETLSIRKRMGNPGNIAKALAYMATIHIGLRNYKDAREYTLEAIENAKKADDIDQLEKNYKRLAEIYQMSGSNRRALATYREYVVLKDSVMQAERMQREEVMQRLLEAEKKEKDVALLLKEQAMKNIELEKLQLESQKQEQEVVLLAKENELLEQDRELQSSQLRSEELERQRLAQQLLLKEEQLEAEKRRQEIGVLQNERKLQELALKQKELEQKERQEQLARLENERELQDLRIKAEQEVKQYFIGFVILLVVILILILISFVKNRRKNKILAIQNNEILEQKRRIELQKDKMQLQRNELEKSFNDIKVLSEFGQKITSSLDLADINGTVYAHVKSLMDATMFGIGVYREDERSIDFINFLESGNSIPNFRNSLNNKNSFSVLCFRNQKEIVVSDYENQYYNYIKEPTIRTSRRPKSMIFIPLLTDKPLGVITVQSYKKDAYSEKDLNLLRTLASYISIALDNAKAYDELNTKNQHITDSIRYAQTIQKAILPDNKQLSQAFAEQFVLFKPKDIVSGDYYWYSYLSAKDDPNLSIQKPGVKSLTYIAAVDCTGHGVPGAFMSMISNTLLNEIVNVKSIYEPADILECLNEGIITALQQEDKSNDDGMDICLCCIERTGSARSRITFTGAKRPLYYLPAGSSRLLELKGNNKSIGGAIKRKQTPFTNNELYLDKGSILYLCTDGLPDQNDLNRKKFGSMRMKQIIQANINKPLQEQKQLLETALELHQEGAEQRDDITVVGVKI